MYVPCKSSFAKLTRLVSLYIDVLVMGHLASMILVLSHICGVYGCSVCGSIYTTMTFG